MRLTPERRASIAATYDTLGPVAELLAEIDALRHELQQSELCSGAQAECLRGQRDALTAERDRLALQMQRDASAYALMQKGMESQAELNHELKQENRRMKAALKPFADWATALDANSSTRGIGGPTPLRVDWPHLKAEGDITVDDCRAARAALEPPEAAPGSAAALKEPPNGTDAHQ